MRGLFQAKSRAAISSRMSIVVEVRIMLLFIVVTSFKVDYSWFWKLNCLSFSRLRVSFTDDTWSLL